MDYNKSNAQTEAQLLVKAQSEVLIGIKPKHIFDNYLEHLTYERIEPVEL